MFVLSFVLLQEFSRIQPSFTIGVDQLVAFPAHENQIVGVVEKILFGFKGALASWAVLGEGPNVGLFADVDRLLGDRGAQEEFVAIIEFAPPPRPGVKVALHLSLDFPCDFCACSHLVVFSGCGVFPGRKLSLLTSDSQSSTPPEQKTLFPTAFSCEKLDR